MPAPLLEICELTISRVEILNKVLWMVFEKFYILLFIIVLKAMFGEFKELPMELLHADDLVLMTETGIVTENNEKVEKRDGIKRS